MVVFSYFWIRQKIEIKVIFRKRDRGKWGRDREYIIIVLVKSSVCFNLRVAWVRNKEQGEANSWQVEMQPHHHSWQTLVAAATRPGVCAPGKKLPPLNNRCFYDDGPWQENIRGCTVECFIVRHGVNVCIVVRRVTDVCCSLLSNGRDYCE